MRRNLNKVNILFINNWQDNFKVLKALYVSNQIINLKVVFDIFELFKLKYHQFQSFFIGTLNNLNQNQLFYFLHKYIFIKYIVPFDYNLSLLI